MTPEVKLECDSIFEVLRLGGHHSLGGVPSYTREAVYVAVMECAALQCEEQARRHQNGSEFQSGLLTGAASVRCGL